jgi:hypothetical protein
MQAYRIEEGKIVNPEGCEVNVTDHCNLSCRSCQHLSPVMRKKYAEPDSVLRALSLLGNVYRPRFVKVLGGEPLLHPGLIEVLRAIRESRLSEHLLVCTNGTLLASMKDDFWRVVDEVEVSLYPGFERVPAELDALAAKAECHGVKLRVFRYDHFREAYSEIGTRDAALIRRVYATCQMAHVWRCHTVHEGHFFKCPPSVYLSSVRSDGRPRHLDGVAITDGVDFQGQLLAYLNSSEPLHACQSCLGTVGKRHTHEQVKRGEWRRRQERPTEQMIDLDFLGACEVDPDRDDRCAEEVLGEQGERGG